MITRSLFKKGPKKFICVLLPPSSCTTEAPPRFHNKVNGCLFKWCSSVDPVYHGHLEVKLFALSEFQIEGLNKSWKTCTCRKTHDLNSGRRSTSGRRDPWFAALSENNKPGNRKLCINYLLFLFCSLKTKQVLNALLLFSLQASDRKGVDGEGALKYFVVDMSASAGKPAWQRESWMNPPKSEITL